MYILLRGYSYICKKTFTNSAKLLYIFQYYLILFIQSLVGYIIATHVLSNCPHRFRMTINYYYYHLSHNNYCLHRDVLTRRTLNLMVSASWLTDKTNVERGRNIIKFKIESIPRESGTRWYLFIFLDEKWLLPTYLTRIQSCKKRIRKKKDFETLQPKEHCFTTENYILTKIFFIKPRPIFVLLLGSGSTIGLTFFMARAQQWEVYEPRWWLEDRLWIIILMN